MTERRAKEPQHIAGVRSHEAGWRLAWVLTYAMVFEQEVRSIGGLLPVQPIRLLPGFYVSDLGLLLPLLWLLLIKRPNRLPHSPLLRAVTVVFFWGLFLALVRQHERFFVGQDLRIFLGLLAGCALATIGPRRVRGMADSLLVTSVILGALSIAALIPVGGFSELFDSNRHTTYGAFTLIGPVLAFLPSATVLGAMAGNRLVFIGSMISLMLALGYSGLVLQTRSVVLVLLVGTVAALASVAALRHRSPSNNTRGGLRRAWPTAVASGLLLLSLVTWREDAFQNVLARAKSAIQWEGDTNVVNRLTEIEEVLETLQLGDHLVGRGLGPPTPLVNEEGQRYAFLHVGILCVWWRFGSVVFLILLALLAGFTCRWLRAVVALPGNRARAPDSAAILAFAPGVLAISLGSFMSGGWSPVVAMTLGIQWGMFHSMLRAKQKPLVGTSHTSRQGESLGPTGVAAEAVRPTPAQA